jgi:hypothetical protein
MQQPTPFSNLAIPASFTADLPYVRRSRMCLGSLVPV